MAHVERISRSLDVFSQIRGSLLVRGEEVWKAIPPGPEGFVLRVSGGEPKWMPGGAGASGFFFTCRQMDGQWGWSGVGSEGFYIVRFDQNSYHYVRVPLPNIVGDLRVGVSFSAGFFPNVVGDVLIRGSVYGRKKESFDLLASSDVLFNVDGGHSPAYNWGFSLEVSIGEDVLFPVFELARNGGHASDTCNGDLYLFWLMISIS